MKRVSIQRNVAIAGLSLVVFGLIFIPESLNSLKKALYYGQGYFPFTSAIGLCICGFVLLGKAFQSSQVESSKGIQWRKFFRGFGLPIGSLIAYTGLIGLIGFGLATFIYFVVFFRILKVYSWPLTLTVSFAVSISCYFIFQVWLSTPFPQGVVFSYLFTL